METKLGKWFDLDVSARPLFIVSTLLLYVVFAVLGVALLGLSVGESLVGALLAVAVHWASELFHHLGHAWAARRTGYPMTGVRLGFLIAASRYPSDEPALPARVHIQRALGGPLFSLLLVPIGALLMFSLRAAGGVAWWLAVLLFLDNGLNVLQLFVPLGFNDGSTVFTWLRRR
ncbi:MAG: hypothetical protein ABI874_12605 [Chloroflexota bacterium]